MEVHWKLQSLEIILNYIIDKVPPTITSTGFAMLKSNRSAVLIDFDPASLLNNDRA